MNKVESMKGLKEEIVHLHKQIAKAYSGDPTIHQNVLQLLHKLSYLSTEYQRLKSTLEQ